MPDRIRSLRSPGRGSARGLSWIGALALAAGLAACGGDDSAAPPSVASVAVTSEIGDVMAVGRSADLDAEARDASGDVLSGHSFEWESSDEAVAAVDGSGLVEGLAAGPVTITARTGGVNGSLELEVVAAELDRISALLDDAYTESLVSGLGDAARGEVRAALDDCSAALDAGDVLSLEECLGRIRDESATGPTDRALLAVLDVIAQRAELLLNL